MATYLIEKYEDILRIERHKLYTEIKRLSTSEKNLRNAIIEKDELIKTQGDIIEEQDKHIKEIENSKVWHFAESVRKLRHRKE